MRNRQHCQRGMSLVEMLISCVILGIIFTMVAQFVAPSMSIMTEGSMRVDLQEQGMLAISKIVYSMQTTTPAGVSVSIPPASPGMMMAVNPIQAIDNNGYPIYQSQLQVFWTNTATNEIWFKLWPVGADAVPITFTTATPNLITPALLTTITTTTNGTEKRLVQQVTNFTVQQEANSGGGVVWAIRMAMLQTVPTSGKIVDVEFFRKLMLRNNGD